MPGASPPARPDGTPAICGIAPSVVRRTQASDLSVLTRRICRSHHEMASTSERATHEQVPCLSMIRGRSGASGSAHTPVVPSIGVVAQDRVQVTAVGGVTGADVKSDPDGVHALQVDCL